jgi:hypothetical protein
VLRNKLAGSKLVVSMCRADTVHAITHSESV